MTNATDVYFLQKKHRVKVEKMMEIIREKFPKIYHLKRFDATRGYVAYKREERVYFKLFSYINNELFFSDEIDYEFKNNEYDLIINNKKIKGIDV